MATETDWDKRTDSPQVKVGLRCRLSLHDWTDLTLSRGAAKRMCVGRRGCRRCGLTQHRKSSLVGGYWFLTGYFPPDALS